MLQSYMAVSASGREESASDEAFAALVRRRSRFVFQIAYAVLRNVHDSEDVVQETFLKLFRSGSWRGMRDERAFLARAAWRLAVDRTARPMHDEVSGRELDLRAGAEELLLKADVEAALHRFIDALPKELRLPLALSSVEEMTSAEIASVMGIPEGTVRTRMARARAILKQKLTDWEVSRGRR